MNEDIFAIFGSKFALLPKYLIIEIDFVFVFVLTFV